LLWFEHQLENFTNWYGRQLEWVLSHKLIFTGIVLLLFVMTLGIMKQGIIGKELISTGDQGKFRMALEFDKSTSIQQNNLIAQKIEAYIIQQPEVATVFSNIVYRNIYEIPARRFEIKISEHKLFNGCTGFNTSFRPN
jgi:HAE1 family hydrophobic/amphiphilic exporter-1